MSLHLEGDDCWPDLLDKEVIHLGNDALPIQIALLNNGTLTDKSSVTIRLDLPDGKVVLAETSLELFFVAVETFKNYTQKEVSNYN